MTQAARRPASLVPGRDGPAIIAHGGGNDGVRVTGALAQHPDYLEVDLWLHRGRFEARHERRVFSLPILFEKWYLRRLPREAFGLQELVSAAAGSGAGIFLDFKDGHRATAEVLAAVIAAAGGAPPRFAASSQEWRTLRAVRDLVPGVTAFYSIDVPAKLDLFLAVMDRDVRPDGVSCRHTLLTAPIVAELHRRGLVVVAWTVDDLERARELVAWGVDGITTHRVAEMRAEFVPPE